MKKVFMTVLFLAMLSTVSIITIQGFSLSFDTDKLIENSGNCKLKCIKQFNESRKSLNSKDKNYAEKLKSLQETKKKCLDDCKNKK